MLIYDCEIVKGILGKKDSPIENIEYCDGWNDFDGMGISVICTYSYKTDSYGVFCEDNLHDFKALVNNHYKIIGFNNFKFDDMLCKANGFDIPQDKSYDILVEVWKAAGLLPFFCGPSHKGYGLDACVKANSNNCKTGNGALAPIQWQRGNIGNVINYCLQDVKLTKLLMDKIIFQGGFYNPVCPQEFLKIEL